MRITSLFLVVFLFFSCKEDKKSTIEAPIVQVQTVNNKANYPAELLKVFEAHGGVEKWKVQKTLSFIKPTDKGFEHYTIDLQTRNEKVVSEDVERGYNDGKTWLLDPEKNFQGDAIFYTHLYFYFYAMPFVLADKGINYSETNALEVNGSSYPGIKVSFNQGIGSSSKDDYYLHYDPKTNQMAWLGYTVTYRTGEKSDKISWIHYNDWMDVSGLKLPKSISWHKADGNRIKGVAKTVQFENVTLSDKAMEKGYYTKPESALYIDPKKS